MGQLLLHSDQKILTAHQAWNLQDDQCTAPVDKAGKMIVFMMSCCVGEILTASLKSLGYISSGLAELTGTNY